MTNQFSLLDEPWLLVRRSAGDTADLGLLEVFAQADRLQRLAGEIPTQDAACLRLLIAILYRALPVNGPADERAETWSEWWNADQLPLDAIIDYLEQFRERFDLRGPTPFMQISALGANNTSSLVKLIGDLPDGDAYFTTRAGRARHKLGWPEAARWLVHTQAFDPSGIKTGAFGDSRVKGGKGYPIGTGWSGQCGLIMLEGQSLRETLLLNLALTIESGPNDLPSWEREPPGPGIDLSHPAPTGPADLLTWQSRRTRLIGGTVDGETAVVRDVLICNGDPVNGRNQHRKEPHSAWRFSAPQSKLAGSTVFMPRTHDPERALWRGLPALWGQLPVKPSGPFAAEPPPPAVLEWAALLVTSGVLADSHPIAIRAVGMEYGANASVVASVVDDRVQLRAAVLQDPSLKRLASDAVEDAEQAVRALADLAGQLVAAAGEGDVAGARDKAREQGYASLDAGYRRWLRGLASGSDLTDRSQAWQKYVLQTVHGLGQAAVDEAGSAAWCGRPAQLGVRSIDHLDSALAFRWFEQNLKKSLPLTSIEYSVRQEVR